MWRHTVCMQISSPATLSLQELLFLSSIQPFPSPPSLGHQTVWRATTVTTNQLPLYSLPRPIGVSQVCGWFSGFPSPNWSGLNKRQSLRVGGSPTWPWGAITPIQSVSHTHTHIKSSQTLSSHYDHPHPPPEELEATPIISGLQWHGDNTHKFPG